MSLDMMYRYHRWERRRRETRDALGSFVLLATGAFLGWFAAVALWRG